MAFPTDDSAFVAQIPDPGHHLVAVRMWPKVKWDFQAILCMSFKGILGS